MRTMRPQGHWAVRMNRTRRTIFFALSFVGIATHLIDTPVGVVYWILLALQFLVYPQLVYWRALHSADQVKAEFHNMLIDSTLLGIWVAVWGLPLWMTFALFTAVCVNQLVYESFPGLLKAILAMGLGVALVALTVGLEIRLETSPLTTIFTMCLLTLYIWAFSHGAYARGVELRDHRRQLRLRLEEITLLQAQLKEQARRDPLTGLSNRRHLDEVLPRALAQCQQHATPLAVVLLDIDHFKRINDNHGHPAGDAFIRELATLLQRHLGPDDMACRYGGEEFLLMLPGTAAAGAARLSEELRQQCLAMEVECGSATMRTTLSFGIAAFPDHQPQAAGDLVDLADQALYAAKLQGRNRIVLSTQMRAAASTQAPEPECPQAMAVSHPDAGAGSGP